MKSTVYYSLRVDGLMGLNLSAIWLKRIKHLELNLVTVLSG